MRTYIYSIFFLFSLFVIVNITSIAQDKDILSPNSDSHINLNLNEYSGLGLWKNKLLLLTQYPNKKNYLIIYDTTEVYKAINNNNTLSNKYSYLTFSGFDITKYKDYDGIEAIAIKGDSVFLAVETKETNDYCYIIKGKISDYLIFITDSLSIKKPKKTNSTTNMKNVGFESLAYLPNEKKLLTIFEYNDSTNKHGKTAFLMNTMLKDTTSLSITDISNNPGLKARITDITHWEGNTLLGINQYWQGDSTYYAPDTLYNCGSQLNVKSKKRCYARIVKLVVDTKSKKITWSDVKKNISCDCDDTNWEGITRMGDGVLLISDANSNPKMHTKLIFKEIK